MTLRYLLACALFLYLGFSQAQRLVDLLPAETFLALGTENLSAESEKFETFRVEFQRLGVGASLSRLAGADLSEAEQDFNAWTDGLSLMDVIGEEAWIAVSASSFNPLPAVSLVARLSPVAQFRMQGLIRDGEQDVGVRAWQEGAYTFYTQELESGDVPVSAVAYTQIDSLLMLSTNPDTLRSLLRQLGGTSELSFSGTEGFRGTLGRLAAGTFYGYLDYAGFAEVLSPFSRGIGYDKAVARLLRALETAGASAGVTRFTDTAVVSEGLQRPQRSGGDEALYALLTRGGSRPAAASASFAPSEALGFSSSSVALTAWWDYLNSLALSLPELGGDLDSLIYSFTGLDVRTVFFDWLGTELAVLTTGVPDVAAPGAPSTNLLGDTVYILEARDAAAAGAGLNQLFTTLAQTLSAFTNPMGTSGGAQLQSRRVGPYEVFSYGVGEGIELSYAVANGYALVATSSEAMETALNTQLSGQSLRDSPAFQALSATIPADAASLSYGDGSASMRATAEQIGMQLELTSGLAGGAALDFDAVEEASATLEQFFMWVSERLGTSNSYSVRSEQGIYSYSESEVAW